MLIAIDKRGSINLPLAVRKELGLEQGTYLDLSVEPGGKITLHPVAIYRTLRLEEKGLAKLVAARKSGTTNMPDWLKRDMADAEADSDP